MSAFQKILTVARGARRSALSTLQGGTGQPGKPLKWYFATDEKGTEGVGGLHARLAVLSARHNTRLRPYLITTGFRNAFTTWMEEHGVTIIDGAQPLAATIRSAAAAGRYDIKYLGHWLRCEIPRIEQEDEFVLYTDCDIVFLKDVDLSDVRPNHFACAGEFRIEGGSFFNTGVMVMNIKNLHRSLPDFLRFSADEINALNGEDYHDQSAYNKFYQSQRSLLDPAYNWKPYWGDPSAARILHFHGAKLNAVKMMYDQPLPFHEAYWQIVGSLVASFPDGYRKAVEATLDAVAGESLPERPWIEAIARQLAEGPPPVPPEIVDLSFMNT